VSELKGWQSGRGVTSAHFGQPEDIGMYTGSAGDESLGAAEINEATIIFQTLLPENGTKYSSVLRRNSSITVYHIHEDS